MTGLGTPSEASDEHERVPRTRSTVGGISGPCAAPGCAVGTPRRLPAPRGNELRLSRLGLEIPILNLKVPQSGGTEQPARRIDGHGAIRLGQDRQIGVMV